MEERVVERLIAAATVVEGDPDFNIKVLVTGIQITYTWQHENRNYRNYYTVENFTPWDAIDRVTINPLVTAMDDLIRQKMEWKP